VEGQALKEYDNMDINTTRKITRSRDERIIAGVAGGLAAYLGIDPLLVRLVFVLVALANGLGVLIYLVLWLLLPNVDSAAPTARAAVQENLREMQAAGEQLAERVRRQFR
jgi:phage shock protein C